MALWVIQFLATMAFSSLFFYLAWRISKDDFNE